MAIRKAPGEDTAGLPIRPELPLRVEYSLQDQYHDRRNGGPEALTRLLKCLSSGHINRRSVSSLGPTSYKYITLLVHVEDTSYTLIGLFPIMRLGL